ncbi:MAG: protein phosphatase CheZ [Sphingomonadales bacterium]
MSQAAANGKTSEDYAAEIKAGTGIQGSSVAVNELSSAIGTLVEQFRGDAEELTGKVAMEVNELIHFIESAKADIASMQPATLAKRDLPTAADELDAIVAHTEQATTEIMDAAESLTAIAEDCEGDMKERLEEVMTKIFEASTFQDITGQRITKVVRVIKYIEDKLDGLAEAIGDLAKDDGIIVKKEANIAESDDDNALLNGPQLDGEGNSQDDIDALLASFD